MKRIVLLLLILLASLPSVEAQGIVVRNKPFKPKTQRLEKSAMSYRGSPDSSFNGVLRVGDVSYVMVRVAAGSFTMGATSGQQNANSREKPAHLVTLTNDFFLGATEVPQALYCAVMDTNPSFFKGDDLPVESVSWLDCQTFITRLNELTGLHFRLPTEAEWEYAARGGNKSRGFPYAGTSNLGDVAWCADNSARTTHPVGGKRPNELGLYDMSGNVWEWCSDWYGNYDSIAQIDPTGYVFSSIRVIRGGSWANEPWCCRVAYRYVSGPEDHDDRVGLRLALTE